jgi:hypothetical protein
MKVTLTALVLVLPLATRADDLNDLMFLMLTAQRPPGASEAGNRVWSAMADQLRREGGHLEVQPDASVTLTKNYQGSPYGLDAHDESRPAGGMHLPHHGNMVCRFRHRVSADLRARCRWQMGRGAMTDGNITPIRPLTDEGALDALRQAGGLTTLSAAELGRRWGWPEHRVRRRLKAWQKSGLLRRRGRLLAVVGNGVGNTVAPKPDPTPNPGVGKSIHYIDVPGETAVDPTPLAGVGNAVGPARSDAVRNAARNAASVTAPDSRALARLLGPARPMQEPAQALSVPDLIGAPAIAAHQMTLAGPAPARGERGARFLAATCLAAIGLTLSIVGAIETATYSLAVGGTLFCALAVSADLLTLAMPSVVGALWRRRSPAVVLAGALWCAGCAVTVANLAGYVGEHVEQYQNGRQTLATGRSMALERLARLKDERQAIAETRPPAAIAAALNDARRSERPALRVALAMARRRDALDIELAAFEQRLDGIPQVATADASAAVLSDISGTTVSEHELRRLRLALLLGLPLCGGLVLSLAFAFTAAASARRSTTV